MAYNLSNRFPPPPKYCVLLDPGAYQREGQYLLVPNKVPFLVKTPRITDPGGKLWTHAIYDAKVPIKIKNCTSLKSKCPRFPYESFSKKDLEEILCRCGIQNECLCTTEKENQKDILCQGKIQKRLFIGPTPKSLIGEGLSTPSKNDRGFELTNGTTKRLLETVVDESPPFYDATVNESTAFYRGCKWSKWTSKRSKPSSEKRPGPADYYYIKIPSDYEIYITKLKAHKRQISRQLRLMEMVQHREIKEGRPGPATYRPEMPKSYEMERTGPKSERFITPTIEQRPGPADHQIKRTFDLPELPSKPCHVKLPEPSFFGVKDVRFKTKKEEGPSPASYSPILKNCNLINCSKIPFGSSSVRFEEVPVVDIDEEEIVPENRPDIIQNEKDAVEPCRLTSWQFKSKTIRFKPLVKKRNEPSPADMPQSRNKLRRSYQHQTIAPFLSSEGRFEPWNDWMPVIGKNTTPGPCYYSLERPKCFPAVTRGPICRSARFLQKRNESPSPNTYNISGGVDTVFATHNQRLKNNIDAKLKLRPKPPEELRQLSYEEQEMLLIEESIALLAPNVIHHHENSDIKSSEDKSRVPLEAMHKPKLTNDNEQ